MDSTKPHRGHAASLLEADPVHLSWAMTGLDEHHAQMVLVALTHATGHLQAVWP